MTADRDLGRAAMENFIASSQVLVRHVEGASERRFGAVHAFVTGLPVSTFNGAIVEGPPDEADVYAALDWVTSVSVPYVLSVPEELLPAVESVASDRNLDRAEWLVPHMVLSPPPQPPPAPPGVACRPVIDAATRLAFRAAMAADGAPAVVVETLVSDAFLGDPDVLGFIGELDGLPVGTSLAIRSGLESGIYAVGTASSARRRGVGTAMTWAAAEAGRAWGCSTVVLQSSRMGFGVYEAMGFRTVNRFASFSPAQRAEATTA